MEALIILKGRANVGKTATLNALISLLLSRDGATLVVPSCLENTTDKFVVIDEKVTRYGIITFGDPGCEGAVKNALDICAVNNCDVIVAASRTHGAINDMLLSFAKDNNLTVIETTPYIKLYGYGRDMDSGLLNGQCAESIYNLANRMFNNNIK